MSRDPYEGDEAAAWGTPGATEPRWREDDPNRPATPPGGYPPRRSYEPPPGRSVFGEAPASSPTETYEEAYRDQSQGYDDPRYAASQTYTDQSYDDRGFDNNTRRPSPPNPRYDEGYDDNYSDDVYQEAPGRFVEPPGQPQPPPIAPRPPARPQARRTPGPPGERDMRVAIGVGVGLAVAALALFKAGPVPTMVLVIAILGVASFEYFTATQRAGFDPLMPVGVVATVGAVIAAYNYGESAILLVLVLSVAVCTVWYLVGAGGERPMANVGATLLGICWVGLFGSFAGLLLSAPNGIALLLAALVPTIGYDIGALFVGRSAGSRPLSAASPSKTVEGLVGGMVLAVVGGLVIGQIVAPFDGLTDGLKIGLVAALAAPLGDLSESLIKRDLGIKDMGSLLPGHGGVLDRFDALLFVLPAIWYLSRVTDFFLL
jgi:CDP-diglyceride synthetase